MFAEDLRTCVDYDDVVPVTSIVLVPSHTDVEEPLFREAFRFHGEAFRHALGRGDVALVAISAPKDTVYSAYAEGSKLGSQLEDFLHAIDRGGFGLSNDPNKPNHPPIGSVFVDGTFDPVGGPIAVNYLRKLPSENLIGQSGRPMVTAAYLQQKGYDATPGPVPATKGAKHALEKNLFLLSSPTGFIPHDQLAGAIGEQLAELNATSGTIRISQAQQQLQSRPPARVLGTTTNLRNAVGGPLNQPPPLISRPSGLDTTSRRLN